MGGGAIYVTIPIKTDQAEHRRKMGSKGGRPPTFDSKIYKFRDRISLMTSVATFGAENAGDQVKPRGVVERFTRGG
jgi:hypothetical protein